MPVGRTLALGAFAALALLTADVRAAPQLDVTAETAPELRVLARNIGDERAGDVTAEVVYQHRTETAPPVGLAPGEEHEWRFPLPPPPGPGTFIASIRLRYRDAGGGARSVPFVVGVATPGASSPAVRATLETESVDGNGSARLTLDDRDGPAVAGRAIFTLSGGLTTDPESVPAQVGTGSRTVVPLVIRNDGDLPPGRYPVYAVFEYGLAGEHLAVIAHASIEVAGRTGPRHTPLLVGLGALGAALVVLMFAWRAAARRAAA